MTYILSLTQAPRFHPHATDGKSLLRRGSWAKPCGRGPCTPSSSPLSSQHQPHVHAIHPCGSPTMPPSDEFEAGQPPARRKQDDFEAGPPPARGRMSEADDDDRETGHQVGELRDQRDRETEKKNR